MQAIIYRMNNQQGPTVQHRELYSMSYNKLKMKKKGKNTGNMMQYYTATKKTCFKDYLTQHNRELFTL